MIYEVAIASTPDGAATVTITTDLGTAHDIAQDLTSRMLGQPTPGDGADERALSGDDLRRLVEQHGDTAAVRDRDDVLWRWSSVAEVWRRQTGADICLTTEHLVAALGPLREA